MKKETLKKICESKKLDFETVLHNCGWNVEELRLYKGEIFKPAFFVGGKPQYQYLAQYEIALEDCI